MNMFGNEYACRLIVFILQLYFAKERLNLAEKKADKDPRASLCRSKKQQGARNVKKKKPTHSLDLLHAPLAALSMNDNEYGDDDVVSKPAKKKAAADEGKVCCVEDDAVPVRHSSCCSL